MAQSFPMESQMSAQRCVLFVRRSGFRRPVKDDIFLTEALVRPVDPQHTFDRRSGQGTAHIDPQGLKGQARLPFLGQVPPSAIAKFREVSGSVGPILHLKPKLGGQLFPPANTSRWGPGFNF